MSYDVVIEQVKALPEQLLTSVSAFIKLLEAEQPEMYMTRTAPGTKNKFFGLAGKIHQDRDSVSELREASVL